MGLSSLCVGAILFSYQTLGCISPGNPGTTTTTTTSTTTTTTSTSTTATPTTTTVPFTRDLITDGGFEANNGSWSQQGCTSSVQQSNVHGGVNALLVTGRKAEWAGPTQELELDTLLGVRTASLSYAIKLVKESSFQHGWVFKITTNGVIKYETIADETVTSGDGWKIIEKEVQIPDTTGAESVKVYLKGSPVGVEFIIDDVSLVDTTEREPTWQEKADIRIDQLRKKNLVVNVDGFGNVDSSTIKLEVTQLTHSFPFGTKVKGSLIKACVDNGVDNQFCTFTKEHFNYLVLGNAMKWSYNERKEGIFRYSDADATLAWAKERNMKSRGHALMWATGQQTPPWVMNLTGTYLINAVEKRINDALTHFNGTVTGWDVNNEMTHGEYFINNTGDPDIRIKMHNWAHEKDPSLELFTNDFNIISHYHGQAQLYIDLIKDLIERGAAISGIGLQAHFPAIPIDPEKIIPIMEKLGEFKIPVWITEFDWNADTNGGPEHAAAVENFYRLMFSLEMVEGIMMWGFWDQSHWRPNGALVNGDTFEVNAAGQAYLDLYHNEWNSTSTLDQYEPMKFQARVFHGDYNLVLSSDGTVLAERRVSVQKGSDLEITISD